MNATSSKPASQAPQRRKRGASKSAPVKVSAIPNPRAAGKLRAEGTSAWVMRTDAAIGSVIFQIPATMKVSARRAPTTAPIQAFQGGSPIGAASASASASVMVWFTPIYSMPVIKNSRVAAAVRATSSLVCAAERNPASNCEGAR